MTFSWLLNIKTLLSNVGYIYQLVWKTKRRLFFYSLLYIITAALSPFVIIIIPKFIIDEITNLHRFDVVLKWVCIMVAVNFVIKSFQIRARSFVSLNAKFLMIPMSVMFNQKNMEMDFEYTEDPAVLDEKHKAAGMLLNPGTQESTGNIEEYILAVNEGMVGIIQLVLLFFLISTFNVYFLLVLFAVSLISTLAGLKLKKINYDLQFSTVPLQRKWNYLMQVACHYSFGKTIRIFNLSEWILKKGNDNCNERLQVWNKMVGNTTKYNILVETMNAFKNLAAYGYLVIKVISDHLSIGNFTMYLNAIGQFSAAFDKISINVVGIRKNDISIINYRRFLTKEGIMQRASKKGVVLQEGLAHTIEFVNVSFKYPRQERYVLRDVSLKIGAGEKLSVVGENGAGKTTFIKLLLRLYDVTDGQILLDGVDIRHYTYTDYLKLFATVFQDFKIYAFTINENIALSQTESTTEEKLDKVLQLGGLSEKINQLKNGGLTYMSREFEGDGIELSGGEQQKLALCRALFKDAPIVILDEPTASLSPLAEHDIYSKFNEMVKQKTAIFISHRLSSSSFCDKIALFDDGRILEYGTHQELMDLNRTYAEMFRLQAQYYVEEREVEL